MGRKKAVESMRSRVEAVLASDADVKWTLTAVAATLGVSKGAVQRGLKAEATTFTAVKAAFTAAPKKAAPKKAAPKKAAPKKAKAAPEKAKAAPKKAKAAPKKAKAAPKKAAPKKAATEQAAEAAVPELPPALPPAPVGFVAPPPTPLQALPVAYGVDRIAAMATEPQTMFVYWELTPGGVARARAQAAGDQLALRVYPVHGHDDARGAPLHDVDIHDWISDYTFHFEHPGEQVVVVIGVRDGSGLVHIGRSHIVELPRRSAGDGPVVFSTVTDAGPEPADAGAVSDADALRNFRLAALFGDRAKPTDLNRMLGSSDTLAGGDLLSGGAQR